MAGKKRKTCDRTDGRGQAVAYATRESVLALEQIEKTAGNRGNKAVTMFTILAAAWLAGYRAAHRDAKRKGTPKKGGGKNGR